MTDQETAPVEQTVPVVQEIVPYGEQEASPVEPPAPAMFQVRLVSVGENNDRFVAISDIMAYFRTVAATGIDVDVMGTLQNLLDQPQ